MQILGLLTISTVSWALFIWVEHKAAEPMLAPQVLMNRTFLTAAAAAFFHRWIAGSLGVLPAFSAGGAGTSATLSGPIITPFSVFMAFVGVPTGYLLAWKKRFKALYIAGYGILAAVMVAVVFFHARTPLSLGAVITAVAQGWASALFPR